MSFYANRISFSALWITSILIAVGPALADETAGRQVMVETHMLSLDADKLPLGIRQLIAQPATKPAKGSFLTSEQHAQLLKAVSDAGGDVLASPTVLLLDGTEAEVKTLMMRRYLDSAEPQQERGAHGQIMYLPHVQDVESGTKLKVKANISNDGEYISLRLHPQLLKFFELRDFAFEMNDKKERVSLQQPLTQEIGVDTVVAVPDGQTLVLGGQTISAGSESQSFLILVRPTIVKTIAQPTTRRAKPAAIAIQTRLVTISRYFADDIGLSNPIAGSPPVLDDAQARKLFQAMQALGYPSDATTPSVTIADGQEAIIEASKATSYVGTFAVAKDAAGKLSYQPELHSIDDGYTFRVVASAVPGQDLVRISANLAVNRLGSMGSFMWLEKPSKLTVQQPTWSVLSANLTAEIPDKHWTVVSSWQVEGKVVRESRVNIPIIGRLLGTNRSVARDTTYTYLLMRPEMLDQMPPATADSPRDQ